MGAVGAEPAILSYIEGLGMPAFRGKSWDLNIIGERHPDAHISNRFLCRFHVVCQDDSGSWIDHTGPGTTVPGFYWRENPMQSTGTGCLVPGHYKGCWALGMHRGEYPALVQVGLMKAYRDNNRDDVVDMDPASIVEGSGWGCNMHHAGSASTFIDRWSAMCQVWRVVADQVRCVELARKQAAKGAGWDRYSYTLVPMRPDTVAQATAAAA